MGERVKDSRMQGISVMAFLGLGFGKNVQD